MMDIQPVSETYLIIYLGNAIDLDLTPAIGHLTHFLQHFPLPGIVDVIPAYTSVLVQYHPNHLRYAQLVVALRQYEAACLFPQKPHVDRQHPDRQHNNDNAGDRTLTLPVFYDDAVGPDLAAVAEFAGLSVDAVIARHCAKTYTVCAIGFAPGFAFLAAVDEQIAMPRQATPRKQVPAGSVGIANQQTAVYPNASPGGWQIIGNCPVPLFTPDKTPMSPFSVGDKVQFSPISREQFLQQGGEIWPHWS
ncbi:5-oxoprolinase subunit PxpB [Photobacterium japonica]|uniref:5-oxoprolinase subunit PxpB n=1 Tax=Photobacterium japonica TaxID=2910235 RepID=UPI003D10009C